MITGMERQVLSHVRKLRRRVRKEHLKTKEDLWHPNRLLLKEKGFPILEEALLNRRVALMEISAERKAAEEEEEEWKEDLEREEEVLKSLQAENAKKREEVEALEKKLAVAEKKKDLEKELKKIKKLEDDIERHKQDLKKINEKQELYALLEAELGIHYGGRVEDDLILVAFTKIHPDYPEDMYYLFFTKFHDDGRFEVHHAEPTFPEFSAVAEEFKGSKDIREFYQRVCDCWRRVAMSGGAPRLATPGARVSIGVKKCVNGAA